MYGNAYGAYGSVREFVAMPGEQVNLTIQEIGDRIALRNLVDSYGVCVDSRDRDAFAALFTPNGRIVSRRPGGTEWVGQGREDLKTKVLSFQDPPPYKQTYHLVANHVCTLADDSAGGITYCMAHHLTEKGDEKLVHVSCLRYDDRYVRTESGWLFEERVITPYWSELRAAGNTVARDLIAARFPPSSPPRR